MLTNGRTAIEFSVSLVDKISGEKTLTFDANTGELKSEVDKASKEIESTGKFKYDISYATKIVGKKEVEKTIDTLTLDVKDKLKLVEIAAESAQTKFEWEAKLDIAKVEASARILEAAFSSVSSEIASTSSAAPSCATSGSSRWGSAWRCSSANATAGPEVYSPHRPCSTSSRCCSWWPRG